MALELNVTSSAHVQSQGNHPTQSDKDIKPIESVQQQEQTEKDPQQTKKELEQAIDQTNQLIVPHHTALHYVLHEKLNKYFVQVVDENTDKVIREIPPKKFLDMHAATLEMLGIIYDDKV